MTTPEPQPEPDDEDESETEEDREELHDPSGALTADDVKGLIEPQIA